MRFGILGPLEVWEDDRQLALGGPQQRTLLAVLLLHANQVVSAERLVDHLWGQRPPATARGLLQGLVAGLRRTLRSRAEPQWRPLETRAPGYLLRVRPGELGRQVLAIAREIGDRNGQFEALQDLGRLHHATGDLETSLAATGRRSRSRPSSRNPPTRPARTTASPRPIAP